MSDKHNKISIFVYVSILMNLIVLALFITFVFGLKKDAFDVDTKKLDRNALICQNSIVNLVKDYDNRLNKIVDSYPFINLLQQVILNGIDEAERDRIISIFRSGNYPFDTVALYLADGKSVFSSTVKTKPVDLENYKKSKAIAFFDKDYDGVYFVKPIKNDRGIEVGYIVASVFKKIFENTSYNLNFAVLPNGVVYYNPSIDINSISIDSLTQYMNKDIGSSGNIETDNSTFAFYSGKVKDIDNFSIGILELSVPIVQRYLKYIILVLLSLSFIFLLTSSLIGIAAPVNNIKKDDEDDIYDESDLPINNYANANIVNDEEFNIDDYDSNIEDLDDDSIKYLNKRDRITKQSKLDLPDIDDVEDIKVENNTSSLDSIIDYDDDIKLDDILEDGGESIKNDDDDEVIKLDDISSLDSELDEADEEDENIKLDDLSLLENVEEAVEDENIKLDDLSLLENAEDDSESEDSIESEEVPNLDDVLEDENEEESNAEESEEENTEDNYPEMKEYTDEELLDSDHILEEEENNESEDSIKSEEVPNLDDVLEDENEEEANVEESEEENTEDNYPEMKEYTDEELLDSDHILEEEENSESEEVPNLDDVLEDENEEANAEDTEDINEEVLDDENDYDNNISEDTDDELEEVVDDNNSKEDDIIKGIDDIIDDNNEGDILISHGSILEDEIVKKEEEYFSSSDAFNFSLNRDFLLGENEDEEIDNNADSNDISHSFNNEEYDDEEVIKPANENDSFDTEDLIDKDLYDPEEVPKAPDDFYREAEEKVKENMTASWRNVLKSLRGKKFINKNMNDMLEWVKEQSGLDIKHAAMLERRDDGNYSIEDSQNISDDTKNKLNINENEALFKKILSHKKTLYVSDPFASDSIKNKFGVSDREDISHMIFVPIENDEGGLKSFFIGLSSN
ncbi:AAA family ATPase [Brachyspira sp.]|uniref:AAA family ATPase n=1 Tax=Brachyspira sp. TaxID=1977261 RepID=UPI0026071022|nr:AAA family ATPase [Brachyspira sp.]